MEHLIKTIISILLFAVASTAWATPITYNFTTTTRINGPDILPGLLIGPVTGSFVYDNAGANVGTIVPGSPIAGSTVYSAISDLNGSVDGHSFSDTGGRVFVGDNKLNNTFDFFSLDFDPISGTSNPISGFSLNGFTLSNVRIFWTGIAGDFLTDQSLSNTLPPTTNVGTLQLVFGANNKFTQYRVEITQANVDEPAALILLTMGLGIMGFVSRRRKQV